MPSVTYAILFDDVMRSIWGDNEPPPDFVTKSVVDKVRGTSRINPENAFDVIDLFGPDLVTFMDARASDIETEVDTAIFTIKFRDGSSVLIVAKRGIGSGVEVL